MIIAVVLFTVALVLYSTGIWADFFAKRLKLWHVWVFFFGVLVDVIATALTYLSIGGLVFTAHSIIGFISLALMLLHFLWAVMVIRRGNERALSRFHRLSIVIWAIWMTSYLSGLATGMQKLF